MSFLRVAAFELDGDPGADFESWDATIGEYLRSNPDCLGATAAASGSTWIVVSEWTSAEANRADMESAEYRAALESMTRRVGVSAAIEPSYLFEGDVAGHVRKA